MDAPPEALDLRPFLAVGAWLREQGLSAPAVLAAEPRAGARSARGSGRRPVPAACSRRARSTRCCSTAPRSTCWSRCSGRRPLALPRYDDAWLLREARLLVEWYAPALAAAAAEDTGRSGRRCCRRRGSARTASSTSTITPTTCSGCRRARGSRGSGCSTSRTRASGPPAYDLVSLLEDARREVDARPRPRDGRALSGGAAGARSRGLRRGLRGARRPAQRQDPGPVLPPRACATASASTSTCSRACGRISRARCAIRCWRRCAPGASAIWAIDGSALATICGRIGRCASPPSLPACRSSTRSPRACSPRRASEPEALADVQVLLPTRRACRSLGEAFLRRAGGRPLLLPRIQPIGEIEADELLLDGTLELALPPAIGALRRQLLLARLLAPLDWSLEHALRLAGELAALLDELQTERVPLAALDRLVPDALAEHWQKSREVLAVIADAWPDRAGRGAGARSGRAAPSAAERARPALARDAAARAHRRRRLDRQHPGDPRAAAGDRRPAARHGGAARARPGARRGELAAARGRPSAVWPEAAAGGARGRSAAEVARWPAPGVAGSDPARARLLVRGDAAERHRRRLAAAGAAAAGGARGARGRGASRSAGRGAGARAAHARGARDARAAPRRW